MLWATVQQLPEYSSPYQMKSPKSQCWWKKWCIKEYFLHCWSANRAGQTGVRYMLLIPPHSNKSAKAKKNKNALPPTHSEFSAGRKHFGVLKSLHHSSAPIHWVKLQACFFPECVTVGADDLNEPRCFPASFKHSPALVKQNVNLVKLCHLRA